MSPQQARFFILWFIFSSFFCVTLMAIQNAEARGLINRGIPVNTDKRAAWQDQSIVSLAPGNANELPSRLDYLKWALELQSQDSEAIVNEITESLAEDELDAEELKEELVLEISEMDVIRESIGPFFQHIYDWYEDEKDIVFSNTIFKKIKKSGSQIYVDVEGPREETEVLEEEGEIKENITIGANIYSIVPAGIETTLKSYLFRTGIKEDSSYGTTKPLDGLFGYRTESSTDKSQDWGEGVHLNHTVKLDPPPLVEAVRNYTVVMVRGNPTDGYFVLIQFLGKACPDVAPNKCASATKSIFNLLILKPMSSGKTAFKLATRYQGQHYPSKTLFGFKAKNFYEGQQENHRWTLELKRTGKMPQRN